jgi:hypothetical protein
LPQIYGRLVHFHRQLISRYYLGFDSPGIMKSRCKLSMSNNERELFIPLFLNFLIREYFVLLSVKMCSIFPLTMTDLKKNVVADLAVRKSGYISERDAKYDNDKWDQLL